jgi:hypothetical protein
MTTFTSICYNYFLNKLKINTEKTGTRVHVGLVQIRH